MTVRKGAATMPNSEMTVRGVVAGDFRAAAACERHLMRERRSIGIGVDRRGGLVQEAAEGEVGQPGAVALLPHQVRRLAAQDHLCPAPVGLELVQRRLDLPAFVAGGPPTPRPVPPPGRAAWSPIGRAARRPARPTTDTRSPGRGSRWSGGAGPAPAATRPPCEPSVVRLGGGADRTPPGGTR